MQNGTPASHSQLKIWEQVFRGYDDRIIAKCIELAVGRSSKRLIPSLAMEYLFEVMGHPSPEVAWDAAPKTEEESAVVTDEIMQALAHCKSSLESSNLISARMAFVEAYKRIVARSVQEGKPARKWLTGGTRQRTDNEDNHAISNAVAKGWLPGSAHEPVPENLRLGCDNKKEDKETLENISKDPRCRIKELREIIRNAKPRPLCIDKEHGGQVQTNSAL